MTEDFKESVWRFSCVNCKMVFWTPLGEAVMFNDDGMIASCPRCDSNCDDPTLQQLRWVE